MVKYSFLNLIIIFRIRIPDFKKQQNPCLDHLNSSMELTKTENLIYSSFLFRNKMLTRELDTR